MASPSPDAAAGSPDPWVPILGELFAALETAIARTGATTDRATLEAMLDRDGGPQGDVALPVHRIAASAKVPPDELARRIAAAWPGAPAVSAVTAVGAFVNFRVAPERLATETLARVFARADRYGHSEENAVDTCVEHTSANPTGPLHVGRVRNGIIGDTLARVLRASGSKVTTEYYVDDLGRQAAMITWIWSKPPAEWPLEISAAGTAAEVHLGKLDSKYGRPYPFVSAYLKEHPEAQADLAELVRRIEEGNAPTLHRELAEKILGGMLETLARIGIRFDSFVWESSLLRDGSVEGVLAKLDAAPDSVEEENGARAIDVTRFGLPKESSRVVYRRGNGTSLYITRDVAYHLRKLTRFGRVIDVLGQDHRLHAKTLDAFLAEVGEPKRPTFIIYQDITAESGGRMSTRGGSAVWLDELLDDAVRRAKVEVRSHWPDIPESDVDAIAEAVGTGAVRYQVVRVAAEKPVAFRWEEALSFEGRSGPFLQYSYARAASILRKAGGSERFTEFDPARLGTDDERAVVQVLARFPRAVRDVARTAHVHSIAAYAHDLADAFNRFYHSVPVLHSAEERASRLALVTAVHQTLGNALDLLGVARLERM